MSSFILSLRLGNILIMQQRWLPFQSQSEHGLFIHLTLFQTPRTWRYIRTNLNPPHWCFYRLEVMVYPPLYLSLYHCSQGDLQQVERLGPGTAPGQVDDTCDKEGAAASHSRFLRHISKCTVSEKFCSANGVTLIMYLSLKMWLLLL